MIAHALTATRLGLVAPVALAFARPAFLSPWLLFVLLWVAIATDYGDGKVARALGSDSPRGQLFDHATDFVFVTAGLAGAAVAGHVPASLPLLIGIAFPQYVLDSYWLYRQKQLRMSVLGRWNGILYFVPLVVVAGARLEPLSGFAPALLWIARVLAYGLVVTTAVSIVDRALAPFWARAEG